SVLRDDYARTEAALNLPGRRLRLSIAVAEKFTEEWVVGERELPRRAHHPLRTNGHNRRRDAVDDIGVRENRARSLRLPCGRQRNFLVISAPAGLQRDERNKRQRPPTPQRAIFFGGKHSVRNLNYRPPTVGTLWHRPTQLRSRCGHRFISPIGL